MGSKYQKIFLCFGFLFILTFSALAQQNNNKKTDNDKTNDWNKKVRVSPKAFIMQTIGTADVSISYSRPGVKERKIWGGLVPFDKVWRAGANEATKIIFGKDVLINGKKLKAGSYGFFILPTSNDDWTIIFNKVADQWGAFEYNAAEDALRLTVKPQKAEFHEWLEYTFSDMEVDKDKSNSAVINLIWDKTKVPFKVEVK